MEKHFISTTLALTVFILGAIAAFNYCINPYLLFDAPSIKHINALKTEPFYKQLVFKPYHILEQSYKTLILGTSRAGIALAPEAIPAQHQPAYNASIGGATSYVNYRLLQQSLTKNNKPETVVLELAFFSFNSNSLMSQPGVDSLFENRIAVTEHQQNNPLLPLQSLFDHGISLLSWDSFRASLRTLHKQQAVNQQQKGSFIQKYNGQWIQQPGPNQKTLGLFEGSLKKFLYQEWFPKPRYNYLLESADKKQTPLFYFQRSLELLYQNNIDTRLVILPVHASLLLALDAANLNTDFQQWKVALVTINEKAAARFNKQAFPLLDYTLNTTLSTEVLPAAESQTRLQWFNDSAHPSPAYGALVFNEVFSPEFPNALQHGILLSSANIQNINTQQQQHAQLLKQQQSEALVLVEKLTSQAPKKLPYKK